MAYIRIDKDQPQDSRLFDFADELADIWQVVAHGNQDLEEISNRHVLRHACLGALVTLWCYADTHIRSDDSLPVTLSGLTQIVNLPVTVLELFPTSWLAVRDSDGCVVLPGYCAKNNLTARDIRKSNASEKRDHERHLARERKRKQRERDRQNVTASGHARDSTLVTPPTGTGTGTDTLNHTGTVTGPAAATRAAGRGAAATPRKSFDQDFETRFGSPPAEASAKGRA